MIYSKKHRLNYDGTLGRVFSIWWINVFLSILTLGIYSFWGKTKMRRYAANHFSLLEDRFEYVGTGGELLKGFVLGYSILALFYLFIGYFFSYFSFLDEDLLGFFFILPIFFIVYAGLYTATRYRYSRTTWKGIRGQLKGSALYYATFLIWRLIVNICSFGILIYRSDFLKYQYITNHTYFGEEPVVFDGKENELVSIHITTWLLAIPTLGLSRFWYAAALARYQFAHTRIKEVGFKATYTGPNLMGLIFGNFLITAFTSGLGRPIVIQRNFNYLSNNLFVMGDLENFYTIQSTEKKSKYGEALEQGLDLDTGLM